MNESIGSWESFIKAIDFCVSPGSSAKVHRVVRNRADADEIWSKLTAVQRGHVVIEWSEMHFFSWHPDYVTVNERLT